MLLCSYLQSKTCCRLVSGLRLWVCFLRISIVKVSIAWFCFTQLRSSLTFLLSNWQPGTCGFRRPRKEQIYLGLHIRLRLLFESSPLQFISFPFKQQHAKLSIHEGLWRWHRLRWQVRDRTFPYCQNRLPRSMALGLDMCYLHWDWLYFRTESS